LTKLVRKRDTLYLHNAKITELGLRFITTRQGCVRLAI